jgi:hypothetical protein
MRFHVIGRVLPERAAVGFEPVTWLAPDGVSVSVHCQCSQLNVHFDWPDPPDLATIFHSAEHVAEGVVGAFGFSLGTGYAIEMLQLIDGSGKTHVFGVRPGGLEFQAFVDVFHKAEGLAKDDVFFRFALRDYMSAIRNPIDCAAYCYRAVESLKIAIESNSGSKENGWVQLHRTLGTKREEFDKTIKELAHPIRHGNWMENPPPDAARRHAMLTLTRSVIARYLQFYEQGLDID